MARTTPTITIYDVLGRLAEAPAHAVAREAAAVLPVLLARPVAFARSGGTTRYGHAFSAYVADAPGALPAGQRRVTVHVTAQSGVGGHFALVTAVVADADGHLVGPARITVPASWRATVGAAIGDLPVTLDGYGDESGPAPAPAP
jgi:hypothetical protein